MRVSGLEFWGVGFGAYGWCLGLGGLGQTIKVNKG